MYSVIGVLPSSTSTVRVGLKLPPAWQFAQEPLERGELVKSPREAVGPLEKEIRVPTPASRARKKSKRCFISTGFGTVKRGDRQAFAVFFAKKLLALLFK
jgi:hypothetical protein